MIDSPRIAEALSILKAFGLPRKQQNDRSALTLLALLDLTPEKDWSNANNPLIGITPIMEFAAKHYDKSYAPNSRETVRRQTVHQFVDAGLALYNPDEPTRPVNSPKAVYQIEPSVLEVLRLFGTGEWENRLGIYLLTYHSLAARYANERQMQQIPVKIADGKEIDLTPGNHSLLIKAIIEDFGPRYAPGGTLLYVGDTGNKWGYFDQMTLSSLGVVINSHGKMPDVIIYYKARNWLLLIESVTSHGPVDGKRHDELKAMFKLSSAGLVFVTAFPNRQVMSRYLNTIAWETEVWSADAPTHLIHFNGERFLGPYEKHNIDK